ncbi:MAG: hypothetical protein LUE99_10165 [Bacteroides sp.]|nr:hypothetical protein [Bacteroides sp.]
MKTNYLFVAIFCLFCFNVLSLPAKNKKKAPVAEQKISLGVWEDVNKSASVDSIVRWMKPFDEAGIKNYYMCGSPEEVARYIEAAKSYVGAKVHAWMFTVMLPEILRHLHIRNGLKSTV